ncbi:transcription elongation factor GreA [Pseudoramibacter faecis]|uniref:transcription elongation factor GreA n=1 Tax=Pseudoramibacter faecis TaxID=3108534 RepID=UPI002E76E982|nr:transcription elongation factor GreA [Pseudoramibacter sp. HA2172]
MSEEMIVTQEGLEKMKAELEQLKTVTRYEVIEKLRTARGYGDLSENSEYDEAKNEQSFVEGRIKELEHQIHHVKVVEEVQTDIVGIGSYVKVATAGKNLEYQIVGSAEANIKEGKLSNASPVGEGLMGRQAGDVVEIEVPRGVVTYEILDIHR